MQKQILEKYSKNLGISNLDFEMILEKNLKISRKDLFLLTEIDDDFVENIKKDFEKRKKGIPLEYILEKTTFFSLDFFVDNRVLIPRNDTEIMVKKVLEIKNLKNYTLIDIGSGSGIIPVSIAKNSEIKNILTLEISKNAIKVLEKNIKNYNLENKIKIIESDLLGEILKENSLKKYFNNFESGGQNRKKIIITANLPYIKNGDLKNMSEETIKFEPHLALFGGEKTGFELYEKLIEQIFELKKYFKNSKGENSKIILFIEIGFDQKEICENFLKNKDLQFEIFKDNGGIWRCVKIYFDF